MKILMIVPSLMMGGMERVCVNYANMLAAHNDEVTILNLTSDDAAVVSMLSYKVKYRKNVCSDIPRLDRASLKELLAGSFRVLPYIWWLRWHSSEYLHKKAIHELYDVEIAFFGGFAAKIVSGSKSKTSVKIAWFHSQLIKGVIRQFKSYSEACSSYGKLDAIICVSDFVKKEIFKELPFYGKIYVLNNPCEEEKIRKLSNAEISDVKKERFTFVMVCRISYEIKGFDRLIESVKRLNADGIEFDVWVVGGGADFDKLKQEIASAQIDNIHLVGQKDNPYPYVKAADAYLCTSRAEGYSMSIAEAMILGKPVVTTEVSGMRDMLGNNKYGLICENSNEGIYAGMRRFMTDKIYIDKLNDAVKSKTDLPTSEKILSEFYHIIECVKNVKGVE